MSSPPRGGRKRSTQGVSGNHLLGFSTSRQDTTQYKSSSSRQYHHHDVFDRSTFLAANFRFGMCRIDDHSNVDWDDVVFLDMEVPSEGGEGMRCPISFDNVELPHITPCGHVFGLVPLLTDMLMKHDGVIRGTSPCPICNVDIRAMELRPVHVRYVGQDPGMVGEFSLVWRYRGSAVVHACGEEETLSDGYYPIDMPRFSRSVVVENPEALWKYIACRLAERSEEVRLEGGQDAACYYPAYIAAIDLVMGHCKKMGERGRIGEEYQEIIDDIRQSVTSVIEASQAEESLRLRDRQLEEEFPSLSVSSTKTPKSSLERIESSSWKSCIVRCHLPMEGVSDDGKMYMYQKSDGQWIFMNLFNMKMLHAWKGNYDDMPTTISGKILDIEKFEQTEETKKRMKPFGHIPNRANITLCEVDLGDILPREVMDMFQQELSKRQVRRETIAKQKARALRLQRRAERDSRMAAVVDFSHMPPLVDRDEESIEKIDFGSLEEHDGVSFAKIAELGFAALGPSLTEPSSSSPPVAAQVPRDSVWSSRNRNTPGEPSGKKKGSKQILLSSTSKRQY